MSYHIQFRRNGRCVKKMGDYPTREAAVADGEALVNAGTVPANVQLFACEGGSKVRANPRKRSKSSAGKKNPKAPPGLTSADMTSIRLWLRGRSNEDDVDVWSSGTVFTDGTHIMVSTGGNRSIVASRIDGQVSIPYVHGRGGAKGEAIHNYLIKSVRGTTWPGKNTGDRSRAALLREIEGVSSTRRKKNPSMRSNPRASLVARYLTPTGKVGAEVHEHVSSDGRVWYSYSGTWGAGSGKSASDTRKDIEFTLSMKKFKTEIPFPGVREPSKAKKNPTTRGNPRSGPKSLTKADKAVITAFIRHQPATSTRLTSTGSRLDINGMGGTGVAKWTRDGVEVDDFGSKSAEQVRKAVVKALPLYDLAPSSRWALTAAQQKRFPHLKANPKVNPRILGHDVTKSGSTYTVKPYGKSFKTKAAATTWLKGHVKRESKVNPKRSPARRKK